MTEGDKSVWMGAPARARRRPEGGPRPGLRAPQKTRSKCLPENKVLDFELGLDHTSRPQSYSQNVSLCRDILRRSDAAHVLKETERSKRKEGRKNVR